jgi:hypothetical protein
MRHAPPHEIIAYHEDIVSKSFSCFGIQEDHNIFYHPAKRCATKSDDPCIYLDILLSDNGFQFNYQAINVLWIYGMRFADVMICHHDNILKKV